MVFLAQEHVHIPTKDILSWCYDEPTFDQDKAVGVFPGYHSAASVHNSFQIYVDAADPSQFITARQAHTLIRKLIAGFRRAGLQEGDCVALHSFNNVMRFLDFR